MWLKLWKVYHGKLPVKDRFAQSLISVQKWSAAFIKVCLEYSSETTRSYWKYEKGFRNFPNKL